MGDRLTRCGATRHQHLSSTWRGLRERASRYARIPLAILLIVGGIFGVLRVLGLWMLPLGLLLFAQDVPALQKPIVRMLGWVKRKWIERQRRKSMQ